MHNILPEGFIKDGLILKNEKVSPILSKDNLIINSSKEHEGPEIRSVHYGPLESLNTLFLKIFSSDVEGFDVIKLYGFLKDNFDLIKQCDLYVEQSKLFFSFASIDDNVQV
ncbi:MAG: hypothetical protein IPN10_07795 [Saprospiraceae bacterium]|nr:hypothetical protein [Saprospiraceae bacterium]